MWKKISMSCRAAWKTFTILVFVSSSQQRRQVEPRRQGIDRRHLVGSGPAIWTRQRFGQ